MTYPHVSFPALASQHLADARLFATREDMIRGLPIPRRGTITEVGVALGDFSACLISALDPACFVAIDTFEMHKWPERWGRSSAEIFGSATHEAYYRARLAAETARVVVKTGLSQDVLSEFPDCSFDLIYVDAGHDLDNVSRDAALSAAKIKPEGTIVFNDYVMADHLLNAPYGVIPAVNQLVVTGGWKVVGFALQQHMFCDIAIRRTA